jgi:hypothetical protein
MTAPPSGDVPAPSADPEERADGELVSAGSFRLDRGRAVDKLAHFQLDDPRRYVAELLAAAVCSGATGVHVRNDADDFELEWDGDHPTKAELDGLFDHIFYRGTDRRQRMLQHLAQGLFGAAGLDPRWVRLLRPGLTVDLTDPATPKHEENDRQHGVRVEVRERFSWSVLREWSRKPFQAPEELALLRRVAVGCPLPIFVDGAELELSLEDLLGPVVDRAERVLGAGVEAGEAWLVEADTPAAAGIAVIRDGILVDRVPQQIGPLALCGWVRADGVDLDASQAGVVRRGPWLAVEAALEDAARRALALSLGSEAADAVSVLPRADRLRAGRRLLQGPDCVLAGVPLFQALDGQHWSVAQLRESGPVLCAEDPALFDAGLDRPQLFGDAGMVRRLTELGLDAADGSLELGRRRTGRERRAALLSQDHPLAVPAVVQVERSSETGRMAGGLGLDAKALAAEGSPLEPVLDQPGITIELRVDGLPLARVRKDGPGPVLVRVEDERLQADSAFSVVLENSDLEDILEEAEGLATGLLEAALRPEHRSHGAVRAVVWRWFRHALRGGRGGVGALPVALQSARLFACVDGRHRSVAELAEESVELGRVDRRGRPVVWTVPSGAGALGELAAVAIVEEDEQAVLSRVFEGRAPDMLASIRAEQAAAARRAAGQAEARLEGRLRAQAPVERVKRGLRGELGLRHRATGPARCTVIRDRVVLGEVDLPVDLPGAVAVVDWAEAEPTADWSGLADAEAVALGLGELLEEPLLALAREAGAVWLEEPGALDRPLPAWLAALLAMGPRAAAELSVLPVLRDGAGGLHALGDLLHASSRQRRPRVDVVSSRRRLPRSVPGVTGPHPQLEAELAGLLVVDADRERILRSWLGERTVRSGDKTVDRWESRWAEHRAAARHRFALPEGVLGSVHVKGEGFEALLGLDPAGADGLSLLLRHDQRPLAELRRTAPLPWVAVVRGPALVPTVGLDGLQDPGLARTIQELLSAHRRAVLDQLGELPDSHRLRRLLRRVLAALLARRVRDIGETAPLVERLEDRPLFEDARGALHGLAAVREAHSRGALATVGVLPDEIDVPQGELWLRFSRETLDLVRLALQASPPSADRRVSRMQKGLERRAALERESLAPRGRFAASATVDCGGGRVWIGLTGDAPARRVWLVEGRPVQSELLKGRQGVLLRITHPQLQASEAFDRPAPAALVESLGTAAEAALDGVLARLASLLAGAARRMGEPRINDRDAVLNVILEHFAGRSELPAELEQLPLLPASHGPRQPLAVLLRAPIRVAPPGTTGRPLDPDRPVLLADRDRRRRLQRWGRVEDASAALRDEEAAWQRREAPVQELPGPAGSPVQVPLTGPRRGALWLEKGHTGLRVFVGGRPLCVLPVPGPLPLTGAVEDPALAPDRWFRAAEQGPALTALMGAVESAAEAALHAMLDLPQPPPRALLRTALRSFESKRELRRAASSTGKGVRARLARQAMLHTGTGAPISLAEVARIPRGPRWVGPETTAASLDESRPFVRAPAGMEDELRRLLGGEDAEQRALREAAAAVRQAQPVLPLELDASGLIREAGVIREERGSTKRWRWVAGLVAPLDTPGPVSVRIEGREVARHSSELPGIVAVVDQDAARNDPLWERARLTRDQERALRTAREGLIRAAGAAAVAEPSGRRALVSMLAAEPAVCRRLVAKGARPARTHPLRAWLEAPLLRGPHGGLSLVDLARAGRRFWALPAGEGADGGVPQDAPVKAVFIESSPTARALLEAMDLEVVAWADHVRSAAHAEALAAARAEQQEAERLRAEREKELRVLLRRLLRGLPGTRKLQEDALSGITAEQLAAATTPGARLALAWVRADAVLGRGRNAGAVADLSERLVWCLRDQGRL